MRLACRVLFVTLSVTGLARAKDGNRLAYLDGSDPYYPGRGFARLTTPQWVGEKGVEAVVILSIDDLRDTTPDPKSIQQYESFIRPILDQKVPVSIMACQVDPNRPQLQAWMKEGVSLECHTIDHPCPLLQANDFPRAKSTYDRCVDVMFAIPGNTPVAFRMPCCDSQNTPGPRFYDEVFAKQSPGGKHLVIDSSVFNITTSKDADLPKELTTDADGKERFKKYVPFESFVNTIEDYPYPYVIGNFCWEFPCATPSDWQAQHLHGSSNPRTLEDWKAQLDVTVIRKGVMPIVFHPHGWSSPEQFVELIKYARAKHGDKVKFLSFRDARDRLEKNVLVGHPLRAADGTKNGVRLLDVDGDGLMDAVIGNHQARLTRVWDSKSDEWIEYSFPADAADARFGVFSDDGRASLIAKHIWRFVTGSGWVQDAIPSPEPGKNRFARDIDGDGVSELIGSTGVYRWEHTGFAKLPFSLPAGVLLDDALRFIDADEDGGLDIVFSDERRYGFYRFVDMKSGWSEAHGAGERAKENLGNAIPPFVMNGTNQGAWFHSRHIWFQNETTSSLPNHVDRVSFGRLLATPPVGSAPLAPEEALKTFKVYPGFKIELAAAEPLIRDPVALCFSADEKLYVVEMGDYPLGTDNKGAHDGMVRVLQDSDRDGRYDKSSIFLENLSYPTGVTPWRNGVLVTCAPDIFYAEDTDNDGRADKREVLYTGFIEGNPQHRVNGLVYGLDNWFYGANGDSGGKIKSLKTGKVVDISGRDFCINPDTGDIDTVTGPTQFGRARDDWGNWFGCNNSNPCYQFVLDDRYMRRNPHAAPPDMKRDVPEVPGPSQVFPISNTVERFNYPGTANHFTSACGLIFIRDELFGSGCRGNSFVSEPVHNLVHREVVWQDGLLVKSRRADDELRMEFIASSDNWFRPTSLQMGPDGSLYIADMYRAVIEHPEWIPRDWQAKLDLRAGHDKGRIYRVWPAAKQLRPTRNLAKLDSAGLVAALESPGGWERDMAQQLLIERRDKSAVPALEKLAGKSLGALARLHALCTLDSLEALSPRVLINATEDQIPGVRMHAVRLSEKHLARLPELASAVLKLAKDPDPTVRLQVACSMGEWNDPRAAEALATIARRDADDPYISAALLSSVNASNIVSVVSALTGDAKRTPPAGMVSRLVQTAAAIGNEQALAAVFGSIEKLSGDRAKQFAALSSALDGMARADKPLGKLDEVLAPAFDAARETTIDDAAAPELRAAAITLLGRGKVDDQAGDIDLLGALLSPQAPTQVQSAAIASLARTGAPAAAKALIDAWKELTPNLRSQTLDALIQQASFGAPLLDAVEAKKIRASDFDPTRRRQLAQHGDEAVRKRAERVFAGAINADRQKVIDQYSEALKLKGDPAKGREFFEMVCAQCHKVGDIGTSIGPDLHSVVDQSPQYYLLHILDPNRAVEAKYTQYVAATKRGQTFSGVLSSETGNSVTLLVPGGQAQTILRGDLKRFTATSVSAMPEGLEVGKTPQDFADLIAFVLSSK